METVESVIGELQKYANENIRKNIERYGIATDNALGIKTPKLRELAKNHRKNHQLAEGLWTSGIHEAKILASMVADPAAMTSADMDRWVKDIYSWDVCDQCCINLFVFVPNWKEKVGEWISSNAEFTRRAGIVLATVASIHQAKITTDDELKQWIEQTIAVADDARNFVKKAVSWQLRQIGKKRPQLQQYVLSVAEQLRASGDKTKKWIASDVARELRNYD